MKISAVGDSHAIFHGRVREKEKRTRWRRKYDMFTVLTCKFVCGLKVKVVVLKSAVNLINIFKNLFFKNIFEFFKDFLRVFRRNQRSFSILIKF
jgi:hypothetical protein